MKADNLTYSVPELCKTIGISRATLYQQWKNGDGPHYFFIGNRRLITRRAAIDWLNKLEKEAAHEA